MDKKKIKEPEEIEVAFSKEQILKSSRYVDKRDILNALLEDDKRYKLKEVDTFISDFLKKEVI
ncbi:hypothetical protein SFBM_0127 [Candidatus Arthromitus sp. SFB-mouse-Japan]|uniref:hypothetical protein n=1 Tax=Candidatus Arthromitus sp. SFB-mouse TaxID=49118 RepID=UPI00021B80BF|nr:hypothetical protein [Candidatus Arthromitus sp. SFB-mouse]EIA22499.1 hypothetical protein SFB1_278G10 [Candidatus Arthromitus sp. SFB-1]EIA25248.1 hypothetical protein SFB2_028G5 [Candidatus Arthromitus sp. SFB-2]EIA26300.1 hypothetical protein SFB3_032G10 [Candidatus Arthromitus sp. SFB-3]EIA28563.1 hypothetical protein SFB6_040G5 [Candidatus Arthromitus sp. SFB-co]EIA29552.1 hypothetical protein SFB4_058G4 [Candidatus Arthromitus sp. SFB-4]EIA31359.1 hypothetical protein SFBSU_002G89 [C